MAQLKGEVAIVGGGLSGMAMAVALDSIGVSTLLIDRSAAALDAPSFLQTERPPKASRGTLIPPLGTARNPSVLRNVSVFVLISILLPFSAFRTSGLQTRSFIRI